MLAALSQNAMSAVSLATQVTFVLNLFVFAVTANASMFAAQYWGKGDVSSIEAFRVRRKNSPACFACFFMRDVSAGRSNAHIHQRPCDYRRRHSYLRFALLRMF